MAAHAPLLNPRARTFQSTRDVWAWQEIWTWLIWPWQGHLNPTALTPLEVSRFVGHEPCTTRWPSRLRGEPSVFSDLPVLNMAYPCAYQRSSELKGRPLEDHSLSDFLPELWTGDPDAETVTRTQKDRLEAFRKADKARDEAWEDHALQGDSDDGFKCNTSTMWNPSREQWIVIWVCAMTAWLLWSADTDGGYGILGRTALFGDNTDQRFGALAIVIGVLLTWQLESRRKK
jgi:hypothetical protein